jgi:hypothetical protein
MERQSNPQLELFSHSNEASNFKTSARNPIMERIWNYEKTILIIIAILITGIVAFSIGVEKGKSTVLNVQAKPLVAQVAQQNVPPKTPMVARKEGLVVRQGVYTIQVAAFKAKANAQAEAEALKKRGFSPALFSQGGYIILCVGNFPNKETAQPLVKELSKRYGNCAIRRL